MRTIVIVLMAILAGCGDDHTISTNDEQLKLAAIKDANNKISGMYSEIASCNELAKCLGYGEGLIDTQTVEFNPYNTNVREWPRNYNVTYSFICGFYHDLKVRKINIKSSGVFLNEIGTMLRGCKGRKCSARECK